MTSVVSERFKILDSLRINKLERARYCSSLTIPSLLPPEGWNEQMQLTQPYSSVAARGVTAMASRMLSALLPLNDMPFFKFELSSGIDPDTDISRYLEELSYQVYNKLSSGNLRESIYQALQHLIVIGDTMLVMEDNMNFRIIRLDRYVCRRDVYGDIEEVIYIEYEGLSEAQYNDVALTTSSLDMENKQGYRAIYNRLTVKDNVWTLQKQDAEGNSLGGGEYTNPPFVFLKWSSIPGENYGRSHCEDIIGDIKALEAFTEGLIQGVAASSLFWMGVDPAGMTEVDDLAGTASGGFVASRPNEVFTISPAVTMNPQLQSTQAGVDILRNEIGKAFLLDSASIPRGERVTATAVRMIGQELENVLGGAFSAIARDLMRPIVRRTVFLMITNGEIDERLATMFNSEGLLDIEIVTGLQALSRDSDLQKLMQMGEMVRNLPEPAAAMFRWDEYGRALVTSLGFTANKWIKTEEEVQQEQLAMAQSQASIEGAAQSQLAANQAVSQGVTQAALQDLQNNEGAGLEQVMQQAMQQGA